LLVLRVGADYPNHATAVDDFAFVTNFLDASPNFHTACSCSTNPATLRSLQNLANCRRARRLALRYITVTSLKAGHYETFGAERRTPATCICIRCGRGLNRTVIAPPLLCL